MDFLKIQVILDKSNVSVKSKLQHPPPGIPRAFDTFAVPGRREFDYQSLPGGGGFDPHALGVGNLNCTLDFMWNSGVVSYHGGRDVRDCSLFMPKEGPVFRVGGVKFSNSMKKGGCFLKIQMRGVAFRNCCFNTCVAVLQTYLKSWTLYREFYFDTKRLVLIVWKAKKTWRGVALFKGSNIY